MAHFHDLSPYSYSPGELRILNVGWLDVSQQFPRGPVSHKFAIRLRRLLESPCNIMRGQHCCNICKPPQDIIDIDPSYIHVWEMNRCDSGEIRVVDANGATYAAPSLVWHYVVEHQYQPPQGFMDAVIYAIDHPSSQPKWS
jgi:hypothetical protein